MNNKNMVEISDNELENVSGGGIKGALIGATLCSSISYVVGGFLFSNFCNPLNQEACEYYGEMLMEYGSVCIGAVLGHNLEEDLKEEFRKREQ